MTKILTHAYSNVRLRIMYSMLVCIAIAVALYGINIYRVISYTVAIQDADTLSAKVGNSVQELDAHYLEILGTITPDSFRDYGLSQGKVTNFISRSSSPSRVALSGHEL